MMECQKCDDVCSRLDTIMVLARRRDVWTDTVGKIILHSACYACWCARQKNDFAPWLRLTLFAADSDGY